MRIQSSGSRSRFETEHKGKTPAWYPSSDVTQPRTKNQEPTTNNQQPTTNPSIHLSIYPSSTMSRWALPYSDSQLKAMVLVPRVAAIFSIFGSAYIVQHVLRSRLRRRRVYHRLLLGMSAYDFIFATYSASGNWPAPHDLPWYGTAGNQTTCTVQGFLGQAAGSASIYYSASVAVFFLLTVRYGWRESRIVQSTKNLEHVMHGVSHLLGWGSAIAAGRLGLYNASRAGCVMVAVPLECQETFNARPDGPEPNCERGDNASFYSFCFWFLPTLVVWTLCVATMWQIYHAMRGTEQRNRRYVFPASTNTMTTTATTTPASQHQRSRLFGVQAIWYCTLFMLPWTVLAISVSLKVFGPRQVYFPLFLMARLCVALQGFFNFVIYIRPRYLRYRQQKQRQQQQQQQQEQRGPAALEESAPSSSNKTSSSHQHHHTTSEWSTENANGNPLNHTDDNNDDVDDWEYLE